MKTTPQKATAAIKKALRHLNARHKLTRPKPRLTAEDVEDLASETAIALQDLADLAEDAESDADHGDSGSARATLRKVRAGLKRTLKELEAL